MDRRTARSPLDSAEARLRPLVIAHRGGHYPGVRGEQTLEHFERAIALGVDLIEVDLRETSDRVILCVHDPVYAGRAVARTRYADLKAACLKEGLPVPPRFEEFLAAAKGKVKLDLEIKSAGFEERVLDLVRKDFPPEEVILKSFIDGIVLRLKTLDPSYAAGLLLGAAKPKLGLLYRTIELFPEIRLRRCKADFVSPHWQLVRFGFIRRMHKRGYPVLVWTLNDEPLLKRFLARADGVITDRPDLALQIRAGGHR